MSNYDLFEDLLGVGNVSTGGYAEEQLSESGGYAEEQPERPNSNYDLFSDILGETETEQPSTPEVVEPVSDGNYNLFGDILGEVDTPTPTALVEPVEEKEEEPWRPASERGVGNYDGLVAAAQGVVGAYDTLKGFNKFLGLDDIVPNMLRKLGERGVIPKSVEEEDSMTSEKALEFLDTFYSPEARASNERHAQTTDFLDSAGNMITDPGLLYRKTLETLPEMVATGVGGRVLKAWNVTKTALGGMAASSGLFGTGSATETIAAGKEDGEGLTAGDRLRAAASGTFTGAVTKGFGALSARAGILDIDSWLAGGTNKVIKGSVVGPAKSVAQATGRLVGAVGLEAFEELPQGVVEVMVVNASLGKPIWEGTGKAAAEGTILGGFTGGVAHGAIARGQTAAPTQEQADAELAKIGIEKRGEEGLDEEEKSWRREGEAMLKASRDYVKARNQKGEGERTAARAGLERDVAGYSPELPRQQRGDWFGTDTQAVDPVAPAQDMLNADREAEATRSRQQDANAEKLQAGVETVLNAQAKQKLATEMPLRKSAPGQTDPTQSPIPQDDIYPSLPLDAQLGFGRTGPEFADVPADKPRTVTPGPELQTNLDLMEDSKMSLRDKRSKEDYSADLENFKATNKNAWSVDTPDRDTINNSTLVEAGGGKALVTPDGNIVGVFKSDKEAKGTGDKIIKAAVEAGGIKLDNFDGKLTDLYEKNGFRVVSRMDFNEEYAPDGMPQEAIAKKPDVVFMVYDPDSKLDIKEQRFGKDDYDAAVSLRDKTLSLELVEPKLSVSPQQVEMAKQDAIDNDYQVQTVSEGSMSPMDFLGLTTRSAKTIETLKKTEFKTDSKGSEETDTGKKFDKAEFDASPSPYVVVNAEGKIIGHEGRHRAIAAQEAGVTDFPVTVLYTTEAKPNELEGQYNKDITKDLTEGPSVAADETIADTNAITPVTSKYDVAIAKQKQKVQDSDFDGAEIDKLTELLLKRDNEVGVKQVENTVAEPKVKPKAPVSKTKAKTTESVSYGDNKEAVLTTESPEAILESSEPDVETVPEITANKKTNRKVIRRTDSIPKGDTKGVQGHPLNIISPESKTVTQDDILAPVIDAMYLSDADAVVKEINSLPQAKRKAAFKEAARLATERNLDVDPDVLATTIEEAQSEIAGRKKLGGQVEMKKDAGGMYSGTHPVSGVTYTAIKGPKGYEVRADKEIVATGIKGIDAAMQPIKDHSEAAVGPVYESKPGDADYTKHTERWKVADRDGKVLEGMHSKKAAIAMRESILTGKEYVDPTGEKVTQGDDVNRALRDLGKTNSREKNVSDRQNENGEVKKIEITPELRAQLEARYTKDALKKSQLTDTMLIEQTLREQKDQTLGSPEYVEQEISDLFEDRIDLNEALDRVIDQTGNEGAFAVGNMLKKVIPVEKLQAVKVRPISESSSTRTGSHYDPDSNTVFYTPLASPQVIVHEAVHGITVQEMQQLDKDDPIKLEINKTLTALTDYVAENGLISDEQLSLTLTGSEADFRTAMLEAGNTPEGRIMYALRSPEEMFSMVLTDGDVRAVAKRVKVGESKKAPTAWQKVKTAVKRLLKASESDGSVLDSILDLTYELGQHELKGRPVQGVFGEFEQNLAKAELLGTDKDGIVNGVTAKTKSILKGLGAVYRKGIRGVDQVLGDIHPDLQAKFAGYSSNVAVKTSNRIAETVEWSKAVNKLPQAVRGRYSISLLNYHDENYRKELDRIHKLNPELGKEFVKVRAVIDELSNEFVKNGLIAKSRKHYFPNIVEDMQGLMNAAHKGQSHNLIAEVKASLGENAPDSVVQERMADYLSRGVYPAMLMKPGSTKAKTLWDVTPELAKFYVDPTTAIAHHIRSATESVEQHVLIGKSNKADLENQIAKLMEKPSLTKLDKERIEVLEAQISRHTEELDESIGKWVAQRAYAESIEPDQQAIARDVIKSKFNEKAMSKTLAAYKAVASATTLGQLNSTLIQVTDFLPSVFRNGLGNTTSALFGKKLMTQDDIDVHSALKDMADQGNAQRMLEMSLKISGFSTLDGMLKRTAMQAAMNKAKKMGRDEFVSKYETTFNLPGEATKLYSDIRAGIKSDNARRFAFNALADVQPISSSQMPQWYLDNPNGRIAYSLKTYGVKMINNIHTAGRDAKRDGITFAGKKYEAGNGAAAIAMLPYVFAMTLAGAGADSIKDLIMGRKVDFSENVIDSFLKLFFASRYSAANLAKGDLGGVIGDLIMPPAGFIEKPIGDIYNYMREDREDTWQTGTMIPIFGKYIHEWYSQEALGKKQRKLRDTIFALNKKISQGDGDSDDRKELREMRLEYNNKVNTAAGEKKITNQSLRNSTRRRRREERDERKMDNSGGTSVMTDLFGDVGDALTPDELIATTLPEGYEEKIKSGNYDNYMVSDDMASAKFEALRKQIREEGAKKSPMVKLLGQDGVEGYEEKIYTPGNNKSGVTVGNGIDFGSQNIAKFRRAGISSEIIKKATDANLWGAKGDTAKKIVSDFENKSLFTKAEVAEISNKITDFSAKELEAKLGAKWDNIPEANKAVVLSLYHIYGNAWFRHRSYRQVLAGDWEGLKKNMEDYQDRTQGLSKGVNNRHRLMSKYIEEVA